MLVAATGMLRIIFQIFAVVEHEGTTFASCQRKMLAYVRRKLVHRNLSLQGNTCLAKRV